MSSLNSPSLSLELRAPTISVCLGYGATALAALAPWLFVDVQSAFGLSIAATAFVYLGFRLGGWIGPRRSLSRLAWESDGRWFAQDAVGEVTECEMHHSSRVFAQSAWVCLAPLNAPRVRHRLWITRRHLRHAAQLRALLVRLRLDKPTSRPPSEAHG